MLHRRERLVEVMEKRTPALIRGRLPESFRMALEGVPPDEQEIPISALDTPPQLVPLVARAGGDDLLSFEKGRFEGLGFAGTNAQDRVFEHHGREGSQRARQTSSSSSAASGVGLRSKPVSAGPSWCEEEVRAALVSQGFSCNGLLPPVGWFGDSPELAEELGELVRQGRKRATTGLLWQWEAEDGGPPEPGRREVVIDWRGSPLAVIEFTEVRVIPFLEVDAEFASEEGEGDRSLSYWRAAHRSYFGRQCERLGRQLADDMPVVCVRFRVLHAAPD